MYRENKRLDVGNMENLIWKYMDLSKFLYLIINKKLYFSRLDQFEDVFEKS